MNKIMSRLTIEHKTTKEGIQVTLLDNLVVKKYSKHHVVFMSFSNNKEAKKEFGKFRQGHKRL